MTPETPAPLPAPDPQDLFDREIRPLLDRLERQRTGTRAAIVLLVFAVIGGTVLTLVKLPFLLKTVKHGGKLYGSLTFALFSVPFFLFRRRRKRFFVALVLAACRHADLTYAPGGCLGRRRLRQLFSDLKPGSAHAEDGITGVRRGLTFWFNEVELHKSAGLLKGLVRIFRGWLLCIDLPQPGVPPLSCTLTLGARGAEPVLTPLNGAVAEAEQRFPPEIRALAARLAALADAREVRLTTDGERFILAIDTGRDLFEGIAALDERLTPALFARFLEELDTLTRVVDALAAALQAQSAPPISQPAASLDAAIPVSALNVP
ncbi:hypothetical protein [Azospirillum brasilense]|uniref:hypothetical protein n=1 Tax=Azospirillum brasilense TaxID=192 RepID=UPI0013B37217|nr:hypothetical protein [Azospirillum brasilense]